jgi:hypothetical protein
MVELFQHDLNSGLWIPLSVAMSLTELSTEGIRELCEVGTLTGITLHDGPYMGSWVRNDSNLRAKIASHNSPENRAEIAMEIATLLAATGATVADVSTQSGVTVADIEGVIRGGKIGEYSLFTLRKALLKMLVRKGAK